MGSAEKGVKLNAEKAKADIIAGTPPGGGLDRTARALVSAIASRHLVDTPVAVVNVPGDGARGPG